MKKKKHRLRKILFKLALAGFILLLLLLSSHRRFGIPGGERRSSRGDGAAPGLEKKKSAFNENASPALESGVISGLILSQLDRKPIEEVTVILAQKVGTVSRTKTGEDGSFQFSGLPLEEKYSLTLQKAGYLEMEEKEISLSRSSTALSPFFMDLAYTIFGWVRDSSGGPLQDAVVELSSSPQYRPLDLFWFFRELQRDRAVLMKGITDEIGAYRLPGIRRGTYSLKASFRGFASLFRNGVALQGRKQGRKEEFRLARGAKLAAEVRNWKGRMIQGARVVILEDWETNPFLNREVEFSGKEGRLLATSLKSGRASLYVQAEGCADAFLENIEVPDTGFRVDLIEGIEVEGLVVDEESEVPLPDAKVLAHSQGSLWFPAVTDREGRFRISGIPPGNCSFWVRAPGYLEKGPISEKVLPHKSGVRIPVARGASVAGKVIHNAGGRPIEGAGLLVLGSAPSCFGPREKVFTNREGTYRVMGLEEGEYQVALHVEGLFPAEQTSSQLSLTLDVKEHRDGVDFVVVDGGEVRGTVFDGKESGLTNVRVLLLLCTAPSIFGQTPKETDTGGDGSYSIRGIPPGDRFFLELSAPGNPRHLLGPYLLSPGEILQGSRTVFPKGKELQGKVIDEAGNPLRDIRLTLLCRKGWGWPYEEKIGEGLSDRRGAFSFSPLADGSFYTLIYQTPEHIQGELTGLAPEEDACIPIPQVWAVEGKVSGARGEPVGGASVWVVEENEKAEKSGVSTRTDETGCFALRVLAGEKFKMKITKEGFRNRFVSGVPAGKVDLQIILEEE